MTSRVLASDEPKGIVGRAYEDGRPVIFKFVSELPSEAIRTRLPWLIIITWEYDGSEHEGMPESEEVDAMMRLEEAIDGLATETALHHAFSRTGNELKELAYYIEDREEFMAAFDDTLAAHPVYPIEIEFYNDPDWLELRRLLEDFSQANDDSGG